jgi:hypothetical protein
VRQLNDPFAGAVKGLIMNLAVWWSGFLAIARPEGP